MSDLPPHVQAAIAAQKPPKAKRSKYGNVVTMVGGLRFDSKKEAAYYSQLLLEMRAGIVLWFCRQPRFSLDGGVEYVADFIICRKQAGEVYTEWPVEIIDVKSAATAKDKTYRVKKRMVEARYGITIIEV